MVNIYAAVTLPVNPSGVKPLTIEQIWAGLVQKCIHPHQGFVAVISDCVVESQTDDEIVRTVTFKKEFAPPGTEKDGGRMREVIGMQKPMQMIFESGSVTVVNIVSRGAGGPKDLQMTFTFKWIHPEIELGSKEAHEKRVSYEEMGLKTVQHTIDTIRKLAEKGSI